MDGATVEQNADAEKDIAKDKSRKDRDKQDKSEVKVKEVWETHRFH